VLSAEEVLVVMSALDVAGLPGLEVEHWSELGSDQQRLALEVARRALQARGFAQITGNGEFRIHRLPLTAVGACAFTERTIIIHYWPGPGVDARRAFVATLGDSAVVHTAFGGIHEFKLSSADVDLVALLLEDIEIAEHSLPERLELALSQIEFENVCEATARGADVQALNALRAARVSEDAARVFSHALADQPRVWMFQTTNRAGGLDPAFTVLSSSASAWLLAPLADDNGYLRAISSSRDDIRAAIAAICV
jgi:hypothetical protein